MFTRAKSFFSNHGRKVLLVGGVVLPSMWFTGSVVAGDVLKSHPPHYHFEVEEWNKSHDVAALRRGYQVYKEVCASCHSLQYMCYRHLVGHVLTEKEAKRDAAAALIEDGPDEQGELYLRPGTLLDVLPSPYKNELTAKAANNGAAPPDLSLIAGAREGGMNYVFSLLTGYGEEVPPGVALSPGQAFNPFFEGGVISMPPPLRDGAVNYPDGTPATVSQMAKDVAEFFNWAYHRDLDMQKQICAIGVIWGTTASLVFWWVKQHTKLNILCQKVTYKTTPWGPR